MEKDIESCIECYEESGAPGGKSKGLNIIDDFNEMYNEELKKAQDTSEGTLQLQIKTLQHWVFDLTQQNKMLVKTVEELEGEALKRLGGLSFRDNLEEMSKQSSLSEVDIKTLQLSTSVEMNTESLRRELEETKEQLNLKTNLEAKYLKNIEELRQTVEKEQKKSMSEPKMVVHRSSMTDVYDSEVAAFHYELEATKLKLVESEREMSHLRIKLSEAETNIRSIRSDLCNTEKNAREMRAALTAEVAEKHDQILALKREVTHLEDQLRQADMQTHFKDDIIKKLREDVKVARSKLKFLLLEPDQTDSLPPKPEPVLFETNKPDIYQKAYRDDVKVLYPETVQLTGNHTNFANQPLSDSFKSLQNHFATNECEKEKFRKTRTKSSQRNNTSIVDNRYQKAKGKLTNTSTPIDRPMDKLGKGEPITLPKVEDGKCPVHGDVPPWANTYLNHSYHG